MKKILLIFAGLLIFGCQSFEELRAPEDFNRLPRTWVNAFEGFWTGMNNNYVFWDIDPTDWDKIYRDFRPKFAALDAQSGSFNAKIPQARELFTEITKDLIDGHFALSLENDDMGAIYAIRDGISWTEFNEAAYIPQIIETYLSQSLSHKVPSGVSTAELDGFEAIVGKIPFSSNSDNSILYFHFTNFNWTSIYNRRSWDDLSHRDSLSEIFTYFINNLHSPSVRGVIVDLRGNTGGYVDDFQMIWGRMFSEGSKKIGYTRQKTGDNRLDFGPLIPIYIYNRLNTYNFLFFGRDLNVPLVLLVNNFSISASEISTLFVRTLDNGFIVGSRTWGGMGAITENWVFNSGQFSTLGVNFSYTASVQVLDLNKKSWEGKGIEPDFVVDFNESEMMAGKDARLEKAIEIIRNNN